MGAIAEAVSESGAFEPTDSDTGAAAASAGTIAKTASNACESIVGSAGGARAKPASGAFDSAETASGAFDSDEMEAAASGALDAVGGVAIGTHAAL